MILIKERALENREKDPEKDDEMKISSCLTII
jgi:hypothetical protein